MPSRSAPDPELPDPELPDPELPDPELPDPELIERLGAVAPGFVAGGVRRGRKSALVTGALDGHAAVAKILLRPEPVWRFYLERETALYRAFVHTPPPVRIPRLLLAAPEAGVLVLEKLDGLPLDRGRRIRGELPPEQRAALCQVVEALAHWPQGEALLAGAGLPRPSASITRVLRRRLLEDPDAPWLLDGVTRCERAGILNEDQARLLHTELSASQEAGFGHGDLLPRNLVWDGATVAVVDWETAGRYPALWDRALLWAAAPSLRIDLEAPLRGGSAQPLRALWATAAFALARELSFHALFARRRTDERPASGGRHPVLQAELARTLERLRTNGATT